VETHIPLLGETCALVGNVRVRNVATIGGNLCEADYASDPPAVLAALGARVHIEGPAGARVIEVTDLLRDFYETSLAPDELLSDVAVPIPPHGTRGAYLKFVTRSAEDRPCVGVAAFARQDDSGRLTGLRVAVGAVGGRPLRLEQIEAQAIGEQPTDGLFRSV